MATWHIHKLQRSSYYLLLAEVEAKNFVLNIGHLWEVRELVVQPTLSRIKEVALEAHLFVVGGNCTYGGGAVGFRLAGFRGGERKSQLPRAGLVGPQPNRPRVWRLCHEFGRAFW